VVVENKIQLDKVLKSKDRTHLLKIIQYTGTVENDYDGLIIEVIFVKCIIKLIYFIND
jgi:hypothetical protein